jgi:2-polyprenyl-3-methyl-5-hydroxy-6-metoxy-1,4-benzoquinol methylase
VQLATLDHPRSPVLRGHIVTDYNAIAHTYREAKSLPIRQYSEAFTFFQVLGAVDGLVVLDVACGDGYYTRALKRHGASRVLGVDSSHRMITYATREEEAHPLGIEYVLGEAETMDILGAFDLVTAAYLLVHATTRFQLAAMCQAIGKQLKPGGRFVALTINPHLMIDQLPRIEQYRSGVTVHGPLYEGAPLDITMLTASGPVHIRDYYWSQETYEDVLHQAGFGRIAWHAMRVSAEGLHAYGSAYWHDYLTHPHIVVLEAQKGGSLC